MRAAARLGRFGEDLAVRHLVEQGMQVLARNWRCREGEIDIVARDGTTLVFVEVKARSGTGFGLPAEAVGRVKARRIRVLACRWLAEQRPHDVAELRFDVISVLAQPSTGVELVHLRGAF